MSDATLCEKTKCPKQTHDFIEQCQKKKKKNHLHASVLSLVPRVAGTGVGGSDQILQLLNFEKAKPIYKTKSKELLKGQCRLS